MDDATMQKFAAMIQRLMTPPTINVNISMDALRKKAKALNSPETEAEPPAQAGTGYPRPYTS